MQYSGNISRNSAISPISLILIFLISTDLSILLDIPVIRQILGFILLAFVPGILFLCILNPDQLGLTEKFVLSLGISISFIMFIGILINTIYPLFGYETPLSLVSLLISLSATILILTTIVHFRGGFAILGKRTDLRVDTRYKVFVLIPILFLPLSVLGMHIMNTTDNNAMLMALLFLIPIYVITISVWHNYIPENAYPLIIFMASISLVLLMGMRSSHIIGTDAHVEYFIFRQTVSNEKWQIIANSTLDSCLSISVLPTTYQIFLNTNPEYLFKILYPLLFSISPLVIYIIARDHLGNVYSFLASIFFMSQNAFLSTTANSRTNIAVLFVALSIMVLLSVRLHVLEKRLLFIIFTFSCVVSHYSTTYIFFGALLFAFISIQIIYRLFAYRERSATNKNLLDDEQNIIDSSLQAASTGPSKPVLTLGILAIFFVIIFLWYSQITGVAFDNGVGFIANSVKSMQDFFIVESRQDNLAMAFGYKADELAVTYKIYIVFMWLTVLFVAIGVLTTLSRYQHMVALPSGNRDDFPELLTKRFDIKFFSLALISSVIMVATVAIPFVSRGYGFDRAYLLTTIVLSSFFVLGGMRVAEIIRFRWKYLVVLMVLLPFFMCTTGSIYQLFGDPRSINLNTEGSIFDMLYIYDQDTMSAKWLQNYSEKNITIYADYTGISRIISQGGFYKTLQDRAYEIIPKQKPLGKSYIYLRRFNIATSMILDKNKQMQNMTDYFYEFAKKEIVYSNGASNILI
jgi:uncharacterized membrane protein